MPSPADPDRVRARIRWRCRRGMKELDLLLERFVARGLQDFPQARLPELEALLAQPDIDLFRLLTQDSVAGDDAVLEAIRAHTRVPR